MKKCWNLENLRTAEPQKKLLVLIKKIVCIPPFSSHDNYMLYHVNVAVAVPFVFYQIQKDVYGVQIYGVKPNLVIVSSKNDGLRLFSFQCNQSIEETGYF